MSSQPNPPPILDSFFESYDARRESAKSLLGFSLVYLHGYFSDPPATFHPELVHALEDEKLKRLLIIGFRGSGKSTFGSLALPLWAALEHPENIPSSSSSPIPRARRRSTSAPSSTSLKPIYSSSRTTARSRATSSRTSRSKGEGEEWQKQNIVLSNGVRILARSRGQKVRGLRHLQYRPKLVIVDDPEDGEWVRTKENRDKTDRWLHSEVMPGMDARKGKLVVIGNLLHMDALLSRLKTPGNGFKVLEFPLIDKDGEMHLARDVSHGAIAQGQRARHGHDRVATGNALEDRFGRRSDHQARGHHLLRRDAEEHRPLRSRATASTSPSHRRNQPTTRPS